MNVALEPVVPHNGVKICGIREARHAVAAVEAGADLLGFNFALSRRRVTIEEAVLCIDAVRGTGVAMVGLFVDAGAEEINRIAAETRLDAVQLHGTVPPDDLAAIELPVIRAARNRLESGRIELFAGKEPIAYLIDAVVPGAHGGTGVLADWQRAAHLAKTLPLMLAGGLTPRNIAQAIVTVRPRAVDVCSGVETGGVQDPAKIQAFVRAARTAFAENPTE